MIALVAHINGSIDFPEEGIEPDEDEALFARLDTVRDQITMLLATADQGRVLREGVRVVIYGATNAGKSSLLNRLLGYDRVIVSDTHGTTRDTIEETVNLDGVPIRLLDTAGLRASESELERAGIERTQKSLHLADLRLHIADRNMPKPAHFNSRQISEFNGATSEANEIVVLNKSDLPENNDWKDLPALRIRARLETDYRNSNRKFLHAFASTIWDRRARSRSIPGIAIVFAAPWNHAIAPVRRCARDYPASTLRLISMKRCARWAK